MVAQLDRLYVKTRPSKAVSRLLSYGFFEGRPLTTRGRWINPLVFAHFALETRLPQLKEVESPIFIVGTGRSGSTILGMLMSMHHEVGFLNEPKALWHAVHPGEDVLGHYSRGPARYHLDESDATKNVRRKAHRLFGAYLRVVSSKRVVDKHPELIFRVPFVQAIFPDAKFVFLVRNGWDTCYSIDRWSDRLGERTNGEVHDWWGADNRKWRLMLDELVPREKAFAGVAHAVRGLTRHTDMAAVEWVITMREGLRQMERNEDRMHMIRYEALIEDSRGELSRLLDFCELPDDQVFLRFAEEKLTFNERRAPFELDPVVRKPFEETMRMLGYQT